ncbi:MAG TPA: hypothetical protein VK824_08495, partial [Planctomycetota bacterium]|nr:hypothetical protein [Planctomycetota bacterium]
MNAQAMSGEPATRGHVLLLGDERDPVCALARESLARCGQSSRLVTSLADLRLSIRLGDGAPAVGMRFDDGLSIIDADVRGVLLRT